MSSLREKVLGWIEHRTGLETAIRRFLYEDIPASSGWHQVLGSVALFLFLTQAFTGILLAFNYAPTPGDAYNSLRYIVTQLPAGRLIRGLHHWGASMMVVVVALHMAQVFLYGAYKKPREATWIAGVVLLLLTLGFGLTGYLLPWDNRAYWGTVVTTRIAGQAPGVGAYVQRFLGAGEGIGVVTFARFYGLHTLLLPPLMMMLIGLHVYLVRKHGVTPVPGDTGPSKKFFPGQVLKDTAAIFLAFVTLFSMALFVQVPLGHLADPTDTAYVPRPDWYFLFLFQTLKFFEGPLEVLGSVVLPNLAILALFLVPFVDRKQVRRLADRTLATGVLLFAAVGWGALTAAAVITTPKAVEPETAVAPADDWRQLSAEELAGIAHFRHEGCTSCHAAGGAGRAIGPDLTGAARGKTAAWMIEHFKNPAGMIPGTSMPPIRLSDANLNSLAAFLLKLTPRNAAALSSAPTFAVEGALVYQANQCGSCHVINGVGMQVGPGLNGLSRRRARGWIEKHFANPQALSPGSMMPAYKFTAREMDYIVSYLLALP